jgi:hypothetical protein
MILAWPLDSRDPPPARASAGIASPGAGRRHCDSPSAASRMRVGSGEGPALGVAALGLGRRGSPLATFQNWPSGSGGIVAVFGCFLSISASRNRSTSLGREGALDTPNSHAGFQYGPPLASSGPHRGPPYDIFDLRVYFGKGIPLGRFAPGRTGAKGQTFLVCVTSFITRTKTALNLENGQFPFLRRRQLLSIALIR